MTKPALVILAAGLGTRFGGAKQLEPVGPGGETILDYSVFDAVRAGFGRVVFVIRAELEAEFTRTVSDRFARRVEVRFAHQRLDALPQGFAAPPGRIRPWGTGHAVLAAAGEVPGAFAVINADDFYGARSFGIMREFLSQAPAGGLPRCGLIGYRLRETLSNHGGVARGVCTCDAAGRLIDIVETPGLEACGADARCRDGAGGLRTIPGDTRVSMNFWGFPGGVFPLLERDLATFLSRPDAAEQEYQLPTAVRAWIRAGEAEVQVLATPDGWCGLTHAADRDPVAARIGSMVRAGEYPESLWT